MSPTGRITRLPILGRTRRRVMTIPTWLRHSPISTGMSFQPSRACTCPNFTSGAMRTHTTDNVTLTATVSSAMGIPTSPLPLVLVYRLKLRRLIPATSHLRPPMLPAQLSSTFYCTVPKSPQSNQRLLLLRKRLRRPLLVYSFPGTA
jgi:hypothetical protein